MEWHFGYNCKFFLPMRVRKAADDDLQVCDPRDAENREHNGQRPFQKCRRLINAYRLRSDLIEQRWLNTAELFVYLNLSNDELLRQIAAGEIIARIKKNG